MKCKGFKTRIQGNKIQKKSKLILQLFFKNFFIHNLESSNGFLCTSKLRILTHLLHSCVAWPPGQWRRDQCWPSERGWPHPRMWCGPGGSPDSGHWCCPWPPVAVVVAVTVHCRSGQQHLGQWFVAEVAEFCFPNSKCSAIQSRKIMSLNTPIWILYVTNWVFLWLTHMSMCPC